MIGRRAVVWAAGFGGAADLPAVDLASSPVARGLALVVGIFAAALLVDRWLERRWRRR